jgi:hypothetical protein
MDMNQYRKHLAARSKTLKESRESRDAQALAQALADFDKASKRLLNAWNDAIDSIGDNDIQMPDSYPFGDDFQEVAKDITTFVQTFTKHLKTVK